jgi:hypothetical protein
VGPDVVGVVAMGMVECADDADGAPMIACA